MTGERIQVFVNDRPVTLYCGMKVKHALIATDKMLYKTAKEGIVTVKDESGFTIGLEGALHNDARIYIIAKKAKDTITAENTTEAKKGGFIMKLSARNILAGKVKDIVAGAVNSEVTVALPNGTELVSIIANVSAQTLKLKKGKKVYAVIKASNIILGVD
jgi:molybdopterin-binding protein